MPPKLKCWTKEADDGHQYTTCNGNQKKKKAPAPRVLKKGFGIKRETLKEKATRLKIKADKLKEKAVAERAKAEAVKAKRPPVKPKSTLKPIPSRNLPAPKKVEPTHDELFEYAQAKSQLMIKLKMMKGKAYERGRNDAVDRFNKKYEVVKRWSDENQAEAKRILSKEPAKAKKVEPAKPKVNKFEEIDKEIEIAFGKYKKRIDIYKGGAGAGAGSSANSRRYTDFLVEELANTTGVGGGTLKEKSTFKTVAGAAGASGTRSYAYAGSVPIPKGYVGEIHNQLVKEIKKRFPVGSKQQIRHGSWGEDGNLKYTSGERFIKKYTTTGLEVEENYGVGHDRTKKRTYLFKDLKKGRNRGRWAEFTGSS